MTVITTDKCAGCEVEIDEDIAREWWNEFCFTDNSVATWNKDSELFCKDCHEMNTDGYREGMESQANEMRG
jgi:hypothetical protein